MKTEKISADDVEVINTSESPEKITKVRVDDSSYESKTPSVEEFLKQMKENSTYSSSEGQEDNPMIKMMGNIEEIKKIKAYFLIALIAGFWSLFGWTLFMAPFALIFGALDLSLGSKLTEKATYIGMIFAIIGLLFEFKIL